MSIADDEPNQATTRVNALGLLAKLYGHIVDRKEVRGFMEHRVKPMTAYSDDELRAMLGNGLRCEETHLSLRAGCPWVEHPIPRNETPSLMRTPTASA